MNWFERIKNMIFLLFNDYLKQEESKEYEGFQVLISLEESEYDLELVKPVPFVVRILCAGFNLEEESKPSVASELILPITSFEFIGLMRSFSNIETFEATHIRADGSFEEISIEEAIKLIADAYKKIDFSEESVGFTLFFFLHEVLLF